MENNIIIHPKSSKHLKIEGIIVRLGIGFLAALITGIIAGLFSRIIMGIIAVAFPHMARGLTIEGVMALVVTGIGATLVNSMIYVSVHRLLPKGWLKSGLAYNGIALILFAIPFFLSNPDNDLFGPQAPLGIGLFTALYLISALILSYLYHKIKAWTDHSLGRLKIMVICFVVFVLPAITMTFGVIYEYATETIPAAILNLT